MQQIRALQDVQVSTLLTFWFKKLVLYKADKKPHIFKVL